jgi:Cu(I)/Ag(I) efflux system membrane fusion protein
MKRSTFLYLTIGALLGACSRPSAAPEKNQIYTCSMHPQIRQNKPGRCPICGMDLTPISTGAEPKTAPEAAAAATTVQLMPAQNAMASVELVEAGPYSLHKKIQVFGEIEYILNQHRDFSWFYPGRVERLLIHYNTTEVKAGTPLLEIYASEAITDQENYLKAVRERYLTTFYERRVADAQVEAMKARLVQAGFTEEDIQNLVKKKAVRRTLILRAPRAGTIVGPMPHVGEQISPENVLFHIVDLDPVWFVGNVFEQDLAALKLGQTLELETKAYPGQKFEGKLVFIDRTLDEQTRTVKARFEIPNPRRELLPKLSGIGVIDVPLGEVPVTVPSAAVIDTGKRKIVYIEKAPQTYEQREVAVGRTEAGRMEIISGLAAGEKVVAGGAFLIDAEAQLKSQP